ncbi:Ig-like domain-containing protein, partial [Trabulsiella odontotermitis]|uniref:Ig-like domain-containing protein n=1 Tax=Trabulsiella odontotermitis TaxID=379893 RepID=UPI000AED0FDA
SWTITIDTDAPLKPSIDSATDDVGAVQTPLANHGLTDDPTPTLNGKAEAGSIVKIYDQSGLLGSVTARDDGTWSYSPTANLSEGSHQFYVTATDKAGNTGTPSDNFELVLDFTPPDSSKLAITDVVDDVGGYQGSVADNGETDDTRPLIKGTGAETGDIITVYNGDKVIGSTTVKSDGTWELVPSSPLPNGTYVLTAKETDIVGNEAGPSNDYTIKVSTEGPQAPTLDKVYDDLAPGVDFLQKGEVTNDSTPTLSGTGVANGTISVYDNGTLIGTTTVDSSGSWSFTPGTALANGNHNFTATVTDGVGRVSPATGGFNIVVDTSAPSAASDLQVSDNVGSYQGPISNGATTDDNTPLISGKAEAGSTVNIIDNGSVIGSAVADTNGNWSFTPSTPMANGSHDITTTVTDTAGNTGPEGAHTSFVVDVDPGQVAITAVKDDAGTETGVIAQNGVTDDTRPEVTGTAKAGSIVTIKDGGTVLGSTTAGSDGNWTFTPAVDLGKGNHTFTATAKDPAGNDSDSGSWTITIDIDAPMKPSIDSATDDVGAVQTPLANHGLTDDPTPTLNGKAEAGSIVKIYDQSGLLGSVTARADGTWSYSPTASLSEGSHQFYVTATDKAGNTGVPSDNFELVLDFTPPDSSKVSITTVYDDAGTVTGNIASGNVTDDNTPLIKGTGAEAGDTITVYNGNTVIGTAIVQSDGTWSLQVNTALADGTYRLTAKETDKAGNETSASPEYVIQIDAGGQPLPPTLTSVSDDVAPHTGALQSNAVTNDNTLTLTGTAEAGVTVNIYGGVNGTTLLGTTTADANGDWTYTTPVLADGAHKFVAEAVNSIGQVSPQTGGFPVTVDTSAPGAVSGFVVTDDQAPQIGNLTDGATTNDATPKISGIADPGSIVRIYVDGVENGSTTANASGNWEYTTTSLADGQHTFTARAEDTAGNLGPVNTGITVTLDTTTVTVTITNVIDDVGTVTGNVPANTVTDDARPEITGKAKAGSIITIKDGSTVLGSTTAEADGTWSFTPVANLGEGAHSITATARDLSGQEDTSSAFTFSVDTAAPNRPTIDYAEDQVGAVKNDLLNGGATDDPQPILHGTAEANSVVNIYTADGTLIGSATVSSSGAWNFKPGSKLPEGKNTFYVTAKDEAGNVSDKSADFVVNTDYTSPDAGRVSIDAVTDQYGAVQGPVLSGGVLDDARPVISGSGAEMGDIITVYTTDKNGVTKVLGTTTVDVNGKWTLTPSESLYPDSINKLSVTETDRVGNEAKPAGTYDVTLSNPPTAPVISGVTDDTGSTNVELNNGGRTGDTTPTLHGTAPGVAGNIVTIYNGNQVVGSTTLDASGNWSFTPSTALADATYDFTVTVKNAAGQESEKSLSFSVEIDATAPAAVTDLTITDDVGTITGPLTNNAITDDNKPTFTGKAEPNSTVNILDGGTVIGSAAVDNNGNWNWTPSTALADGAHQFTTTVTDSVGNTGAPTSPVTINVDTQAPGITLSIDGYLDDVGTNKGVI